MKKACSVCILVPDITQSAASFYQMNSSLTALLEIENLDERSQQIHQLLVTDWSLLQNRGRLLDHVEPDQTLPNTIIQKITLLNSCSKKWEENKNNTTFLQNKLNVLHGPTPQEQRLVDPSPSTLVKIITVTSCDRHVLISQVCARYSVTVER